MVANVKRQRIITGEAPVEELQRRLIEERKELAKDAALQLGCEVDELKYNINNLGVYTFAKMTTEDMINLSTLEATQKRVIQVKKDRGVFDE